MKNVPLHTRITNIDASHQGIDGAFKRGDEFFIVEAKYKGTATLNSANDITGLPKQMTDEWITQNNYERLTKAVGKENAQTIIDNGYKKILAEVAPDGSVIYKELDASANTITIFTP